MPDMIKRNSQPDLKENKTTRIIAASIGTLLAFAGFEHGLFEALQGNKPSEGFFIKAVGESMRWWIHGSEDAFTIIPNYLLTGIFAIGVSIFIIIWSLYFLHKKHGTIVFLLLFILLTLVGGGIGFIPFYIVTWAYATRINKTLDWWRKVLSGKTRKHLAKVWPYSLTATVVFWLTAIEIAIFGYFPGQTDADVLLNICWTFLLIAMIFINLSFISGFAHDIERAELNY